MDQTYSLQKLISEEEIQQRIVELAAEISVRFEDRPLTLLGVMTGSLLFLADLMKQLQIPHRVGVLQASSYPGTATSPGPLKANLEFLPDIAGRDVLLIDDILDTGQTLHKLMAALQDRRPNCIETAVLLWKKARTQVAIEPEFVGFPIDDKFVVGYGLDYDDDFRHLRDICVIEFQNVE